MNEEVTRAERRLVRWYYVLPALGQRGFFPYSFIIGAEWLLLCMIDDLVFHDPVLYLGGLFAMLAVIIALNFNVCYAMLAARIELNKKAWSSVARKAHAARRRLKRAGTAADGDGGPRGAAEGDGADGPDGRAHWKRVRSRRMQSVLTYREDTDGLAAAARHIAEPLGIDLPDPSRVCHAVLAVFMIALAAVYLPHFAVRSQIMQQQMETAAASTGALEESFTRSGLDAFEAGPGMGHEEVSYYVTGDIVDEAGEETGSSVRVDVDNAGRVIEVCYTIDTDPAAGAEENLAHVRADLSRMHAAVEGAGVEGLVPGLVSAGELPAAFEEAFLEADMSEGFSIDRYDVGDAGIVDGAELRMLFVAGPEDTWDGSDDCYVMLTVEVDDELLMESLPR